MSLPLQPGDALPDFLLPEKEGVSRFFYEVCCGKATVVLLTSKPAALEQLQPSEAFNLVAIVSGEVSRAMPAWPLLQKADALCLRLCGNSQPELQALILGPDLRLADRLQAPTQADLLARVQALVPRQESQMISQAAPILMIPEVISPALCAALLTCWQQAHKPSGMVRLQEGKQVLMPDLQYKSRLDHSLQDQGLIAELNHALQRRLIPVMARSFHYVPERCEGFKIVCYPADQAGHFAPHRDNISADTRHRHFALSLNLNDDYEGGELAFPEFSNDRYRVPSGAAMVFSGSLLHKVHRVTKGCRYVALSFLWQERHA